MKRWLLIYASSLASSTRLEWSDRMYCSVSLGYGPTTKSGRYEPCESCGNNDEIHITFGTVGCNESIVYLGHGYVTGKSFEARQYRYNAERSTWRPYWSMREKSEMVSRSTLSARLA